MGTNRKKARDLNSMPDRSSIGYVRVEADGDVFKGALLVVDDRGIPLDFRYTDPVSPTKLERVLYGEALDVYIQEDVILGSLLEAVEEKPDIWVCEDRRVLLPLVRMSKSLSASIDSTSRAPLDSPGATVPLPEENTFLVQTDLMGPPYRVTVEKAEVLDKVVSLLVNLSSTMELLEPFNRISKAVEALD